MAHVFRINEIVETCCQFIKKQLQVSNCLGLYRFALKHNLQDLTQTIWNYILVCLNDSFLVNTRLSLRIIFRALFKIIMNFWNYLLKKLNHF
jgi:hypothetical protein